MLGSVQLDQKGFPEPFSLHAELDSGSQCMAITHSDFNASFPDNVLLQPSQTLHNFDGSLIMCVQGYFCSEAHFANRSCSVNVYVLYDSCAPVIGRDLMIRLSMQLDCEAGQVQHTQGGCSMGVAPSYPTSLSTPDFSSPASTQSECTTQVPLVVSGFVVQHPDLISIEIGTFPEFQLQIKLSPDAIPVVVKAQPIPYAIQEKVANAVRLLDSQGIWEKADKGEWAHPMVTPAKPDGMVRIMMDLSWLSKFVIPTRFPLPTLMKIFQKVRGSAFLSTLDL